MVASTGQMTAGAVLLRVATPAVAWRPASSTSAVVVSVLLLGTVGTEFAYVSSTG